MTLQKHTNSENWITIFYSPSKSEGVELHNGTAKINPSTQLKEAYLLKQLLKSYGNEPRVLGLYCYYYYYILSDFKF